MSSIHILILNYNGLDLLQECLPSVAEAARLSPVPTRVSVVDNASRDASRAWVAQALPQVGWIQRPDNTILFAYNQVARDLDDEYLLLLNNDIKVAPDFITPLLGALQAEPDAFAASPLWLDFDGVYNGGMHRCGRRLSLAWTGPGYPASEAESRRSGRTLYTGNGLFRRDKFLALGGFDPLFHPMGWEDADLGARAWSRGWPTLYEPASLIHHKSSASIKRSYSVHRRAVLGFRNGALWLAANAPAAELWKALLLLPVTVPACLLTGRIAQVEGLARSLPRLPAALRRRRALDDRSWWAEFSAAPRPQVS